MNGLLWLTDTSAKRKKSHYWGLKIEAGRYLVLYSACGLFGEQKDMCTTDMQRCGRCRFIRKARRNL